MRKRRQRRSRSQIAATLVASACLQKFTGDFCAFALAAAADPGSGSGGSCSRGSKFGDVAEFWRPDWAPERADFVISHRSVPYTTSQYEYEVSVGELGINRWTNTSVHSGLDKVAAAYANGVVDHETGLPVSRTGGWPWPTETDLHEYWDDGFLPERFNVLLQKGSLAMNVELVEDEPVPILPQQPRRASRAQASSSAPQVADDALLKQNVLRLHATFNASGAEGKGEGTGALVQTARLFASGFYEIKARIPPKQGLVFALWTFHYETHRPAGDPMLHGDVDDQYLNVTGGLVNILNHEIDFEMPGSCLSLCDRTGGCGGQFATANLNAYQYANPGGTGPAYSSLCVNASAAPRREDRRFIDGKWHTYGFEWHSGDEDVGTGQADSCTPRVDFFFDGEYIATNDVFVPTRGSRFVFGLYPSSNKFWTGDADFTETYMDVAEVHVCRFGEHRDAAYPQIVDQPLYHPNWENKTLAPRTRQPAVRNRPLHARHQDVCSFAPHYPVPSPMAPAPKTPAPKAPAPKSPSPTSPCDKATNRPDGCRCTSSKECQSRNCDASGKCEKVPAPAPSVHPSPATPENCSKPAGRPNGCACDHSFECVSNWCNGKCEPEPPALSSL